MEGSRVEHKLEVGREAAVASGAKASLPSVTEPLFYRFCVSNLPFHSWILFHVSQRRFS